MSSTSGRRDVPGRSVACWPAPPDNAEWKRIRRALGRTLRRVVTQQALFAGNRESFRRSFLSRDSILVWVAITFRRRRREYHALLKSTAYPQLAWLAWLELRDHAAVERWMSQVRVRLDFRQPGRRSGNGASAEHRV